MEKKFMKRFLSFERSLDSLSEARDRDRNDSFVLSGTAAKFSITFELAWKTMKDILIEYYAITDFVDRPPGRDHIPAVCRTIPAISFHFSSISRTSLNWVRARSRLCPGRWILK